ncbi:MAG: thioredoxin domain-containing protein [Rhodothermales bacterium]|nr:thioredoxin domain-containing protein [Rhodothermales bacterium]
MRFLVTDDDTQLFLLAADPVDVSMTDAELAEERAQLAQAASSQARDRHAQLLSLSQDAPSLGPAAAPVTIIEFSDFQCPFCARVVPTVKELLAKYPDQVRLVFMDFPLNIHDWAEPAAIAAGCTARQSNDAFWALHDYYFANQDAITADNVIERSRSTSADFDLDMNLWDTCATDSMSEVHQLVRGRMQMAMRVAQSFGASGTPTFFVNGRFISGAQPLEAFEELVQQALVD